MQIISLREQPEYADRAIAYIDSKWGGGHRKELYEDCILHSLTTPSALPRWYILMDGDDIAGCAGLITNDFISRMDLMPWLCALYIEETYRGRSLGKMLVEHIKGETKQAGFPALYLCTDHIGYYEKYGFHYIGQGYHPWGENSRIYEFRFAEP